MKKGEIYSMKTNFLSLITFLKIEEIRFLVANEVVCLTCTRIDVDTITYNISIIYKNQIILHSRNDFLPAEKTTRREWYKVIRKYNARKN